MPSFKKPATILSILIWLTLIAIAGQIIFFTIHYQVSDLMDSLVQSSLSMELLHLKILLPLISFLFIQVISYLFFIAWIWFSVMAVNARWQLPHSILFWVSCLIWLIGCITILGMNNYFYPHSFFAGLIPIPDFLFFSATFISGLITVLAFYYCFFYGYYRKSGIFFLILFLSAITLSIYDSFKEHPGTTRHSSIKPNIILIGLDSVRPDFVSYFEKTRPATLHIDHFLQQAAIFTEAYTPLARTFTSWMSILTGQYPIHHHARCNLTDPEHIVANETLAQRLQHAGYETIYATDEKRFSNIDERYGFDKILGPRMGVDDFILGGLSDFPLTNLLVNTALGQRLFPYNFANRAAAITYEPNRFLEQVKSGLATRTEKPLFLAIHLCISHWPYTWARDQQPDDFNLGQRYQSSVLAVDQQFGQLMNLLQQHHLLENSLVVILSDHGTTVGLPHDRITQKNKYVGDHTKLHLLKVSSLNSSSLVSPNYRFDTSYGQGTDVLSLKQYHTLLAMRGFGFLFPARTIQQRVLLSDIAPTVLDFLKLAPLKKGDGISLITFLHNDRPVSRPLFIESGYTLTEIEKNDIFVAQVLKKTIGAYQINPDNGLVSLKNAAEKSLIQNKQYALLLDDWLLARYPATSRTKLNPSKQDLKQLVFTTYYEPPFYVIANLKTQKWSIGLDSPIAKQAPLGKLRKLLEGFYRADLTDISS